MLSKRIQKLNSQKDTNKDQNEHFFVSVQHSNNKIYTVDMILDHATVEQTMRLAIAKLNNTYKLKLSDDLELYEMYAARKNGKKKSDLPAISTHQVINKTGMKRFALYPLWLKSKNNSSGELLTLRSIETTFTDKRVTKELKPVDMNVPKTGCFCFC